MRSDQAVWAEDEVEHGQVVRLATAGGLLT